jgi:DNA-nicking Smr family endonuclease
MTRRLDNEDLELWERLTKSVRPLGRPARPLAKAAKAEPPDSDAPAKTARPSAPARAVHRPPAAPPPRLSGLEEKERRRLRRRLLPIDDRLDLHGMSQARAFAALGAFLRRAQARGDRIVLVVTGKAREGEERGVLRQAVPEWLARPDFRPLVSACEEAGRPHGGAGALYVRIKRRAR